MRRTVTTTVVMTASAVLGVNLIAAPSASAAPRAAYYNGDQAAQIVENLLQGAAVGSVTCGITSIVKKMKKLKGKPGLGAIAAYSAEISASQAGTKDTCKLAKQLALAATWVAYIGSTNDRVYVQDEVTSATGTISKTYTYTFVIGRNPSDTRTFSGSVKLARWS